MNDWSRLHIVFEGHLSIHRYIPDSVLNHQNSILDISHIDQGYSAPNIEFLKTSKIKVRSIFLIAILSTAETTAS